MSSSSRKSGGSKVTIQYENDHDPQNGEVFILLSGVKGKEVDKSFAKHWAIGIKLEDGDWVRLEGLREEDQLKSSYSRSGNTPLDRILPASGIKVMLNSPDSFVPMQFLKCLSVDPISKIRASPKQLQGIARSIPDSLYTLSFNDCQTWLLKAMEQLRRYNCGFLPPIVNLAKPASVALSAVGTRINEAGKDWEKDIQSSVDAHPHYDDYSDEAQETIAAGNAAMYMGRVVVGGVKAIGDVGKYLFTGRR